MKKLFLIAIVSIFFLASKAQGNLQFNQVLTYSGTLPWTTNQFPGTLSPAWAVPPGKAWKVEAFPALSGGLYLTLNSVFIQSDAKPLWLKSGDQIQFGWQLSCCATGTYYLSILEFNITQ